MYIKVTIFRFLRVPLESVHIKYIYYIFIYSISHQNTFTHYELLLVVIQGITIIKKPNTSISTIVLIKYEKNVSIELYDKSTY